MLFQTTSAHEELRAKIRSFAEEEIKPLAFLMDQNNEFPEEAVKKLGKLGWMGIPYPKEYGGAGLDALSYAIAVEELARVDGGAGVILSALKEIRFGPQTDDHDYNFKLKHAKGFLEDGDKVKAYVFFKGRSILFKEQGEVLLLRFANDLEDYAKVDQMPILEGKRMTIQLSPKKSAAPKKPAAPKPAEASKAAPAEEQSED